MQFPKTCFSFGEECIYKDILITWTKKIMDWPQGSSSAFYPFTALYVFNYFFENWVLSPIGHVANFQERQCQNKYRWYGPGILRSEVGLDLFSCIEFDFSTSSLVVSIDWLTGQLLSVNRCQKHAFSAISVKIAKISQVTGADLCVTPHLPTPCTHPDFGDFHAKSCTLNFGLAASLYSVHFASISRTKHPHFIFFLLFQSRLIWLQYLCYGDHP